MFQRYFTTLHLGGSENDLSQGLQVLPTNLF